MTPIQAWIDCHVWRSAAFSSLTEAASEGRLF
jgi:hypothetical protein